MMALQNLTGIIGFFHIPDADDAVVATRGQPRPIRAEGDRAEEPEVGSQNRWRAIKLVGVPEPDLAVHGNRRQGVALRGKGEVPNRGLAIEAGESLRGWCPACRR